MSLPNYDAWKEGAFDPPSMRTGNHPYAIEPPECPECHETMEGDGDAWRCPGCGHVDEPPEPDYDDLRERAEERRAEDRYGY